MAASRLEKIGTIYSRASGLMKSGAKRWEDRPIWFDVYEAFPPKEEPRYDRPAPNLKLRQIFYEEDKIRALFHKHNKNIGVVNLLNHKDKTLTQKFIECYHKVAEKYDEKEESQKVYNEALELLKREYSMPKEMENSHTDVGGHTTEEKNVPVNINISDIFK